MKKNTYKLAMIAGVVATFSLANTCVAEESASDESKKQISRQTARQISTAIVKRVVTGEMTEDEASSSFMPDSLWSLFSWTRLTGNAGSEGFKSNIYQTTTGVDKKFGDFYVGATVAYTGAVTTFGGTLTGRGSSGSVNIVPYLAYVFNQNFFISAFSGYSYTNSQFNTDLAVFGNNYTTSIQDTTHGTSPEIDLNGLYVANNWILTGKLGARYSYNSSSSSPIYIPGISIPGTTYSTPGQWSPGQKSTTGAWTFLTEASGGYKFDNGIKVATGLLYEDYLAQGHSRAKSSLFYNAALEYSINKSLTIGSNVSTNILNSGTDLVTVGVNMRLAL